MKKRASFLAAVAASSPAAAPAKKPKRLHVPGCLSRSCDARIGHRWALKHPKAKIAGPFVASSTSYCPGSAGTTMANGQTVHVGAAASNRHSLGTRIRLIGQRFMGRALFTIEDRIGYGSDLDLWAPSCSTSVGWGRRTVRYVVVGS